MSDNLSTALKSFCETVEDPAHNDRQDKPLRKETTNMIDAEVREIVRSEIEAWRKQDWLVSHNLLKRGAAIMGLSLIFTALAYGAVIAIATILVVSMSIGGGY